MFPDPPSQSAPRASIDIMLITYPTNQLTNFMEHSPSGKAISFSAVQEIARFLWKPKFHHRVHNSRSTAPLVNHINAAHTLTF
jgi:hypothetical protein